LPCTNTWRGTRKTPHYTWPEEGREKWYPCNLEGGGVIPDRRRRQIQGEKRKILLPPQKKTYTVAISEEEEFRLEQRRGKRMLGEKGRFTAPKKGKGGGGGGPAGTEGSHRGLHRLRCTTRGGGKGVSKKKKKLFIAAYIKRGKKSSGFAYRVHATGKRGRGPP